MGDQSKLRGKAEILSEIYVSAEVETMIRSLKPPHLQDDIKQHCFLELLETDEAKIMDLYERGKLKPYICKVLYNTARFTRTSFAKEQGKEIPFSDLFTHHKSGAVENDEYIEDTIDRNWDMQRFNGLQQAEPGTDNDFENIEIDLTKLHWYKREMLKLYAEQGTYQKVSDLTHIPMTSVYQTVLETRKQILKEYHESQRH